MKMHKAGSKIASRLMDRLDQMEAIGELDMFDPHALADGIGIICYRYGDKGYAGYLARDAGANWMEWDMIAICKGYFSTLDQLIAFYSQSTI